METYDFAIIGAGAAGLHLALKMAKDPFFENKTLLIFDKEEKILNDKTWSFWEKGTSQWDDIVSKKWNKTIFYSRDQKFEFDLKPYFYKTIHSKDFYNYARSILATKANISWYTQEVFDVKYQTIHCGDTSFKANHIFDSRIPAAFNNDYQKYNSLLQHFKGWVIETDHEVFDASSFTMMDYRLTFKDQSSFMYVLPFTSNKALIEFTFFNLELVTDEEYEEMFTTYLSKFLNIKNYNILEVEKGVIPMSDYPFHKHHTPIITKIGTAGGWVRPSSGYSFKNAEKYSQKIIENIKKRKIPSKGVAVNRHRRYDKVFLNVLKNHNAKGPDIFTKFYTNHPIQQLFRFLDEESSLKEDIEIILSYNNKEFIMAASNFFK